MSDVAVVVVVAFAVASGVVAVVVDNAVGKNGVGVDVSDVRGVGEDVVVVVGGDSGLSGDDERKDGGGDDRLSGVGECNVVVVVVEKADDAGSPVCAMGMSRMILFLGTWKLKKKLLKSDDRM